MRLRALAILIAGALVTGCGSDSFLNARDGRDTTTCTVGRIVDGDTIECSGQTVRLILVDTPEQGEPGAEAATEYTRRHLLGESVELERDVSNRGPYDRLLRYVWLDGELFNEMLVDAGHAEVAVYPPDTKYRERIER